MIDKTTDAVKRQVRVMGCDAFEVGLFKPNAPANEPTMLPRTWDADTLFRSIGWLRHQNRNGRNIYIRPKGEHNLSLIDDLNFSSVQAMKNSGFEPAIIVQTSPGNFQAWVKHPEILDKETGTAAARALARRFGADTGAADWRHFGRMAGFTNRKEKYRSDDGLYPFVLLIEASGTEYQKGRQFIDEVRVSMKQDRTARKQAFQAGARNPSTSRELKSIDSFRSDPRYGGDGTRIDLAYAIYAFSHGADSGDVAAALRSRDLSHKGNDRRQDQYVERTTKKALSTLRGEGLGR